jgi:hypothetical protein
MSDPEITKSDYRPSTLFQGERPNTSKMARNDNAQANKLSLGCRVLICSDTTWAGCVGRYQSHCKTKGYAMVLLESVHPDYKARCYMTKSLRLLPEDDPDTWDINVQYQISAQEQWVSWLFIEPFTIPNYQAPIPQYNHETRRNEFGINNKHRTWPVNNDNDGRFQHVSRVMQGDTKKGMLRSVADLRVILDLKKRMGTAVGVGPSILRNKPSTTNAPTTNATNHNLFDDSDNEDLLQSTPPQPNVVPREYSMSNRKDKTYRNVETSMDYEEVFTDAYDDDSDNQSIDSAVLELDPTEGPNGQRNIVNFYCDAEYRNAIRVIADRAVFFNFEEKHIEQEAIGRAIKESMGRIKARQSTSNRSDGIASTNEWLWHDPDYRKATRMIAKRAKVYSFEPTNKIGQKIAIEGAITQSLIDLNRGE